MSERLKEMIIEATESNIGLLEYDRSLYRSPSIAKSEKKKETV